MPPIGSPPAGWTIGKTGQGSGAGRVGLSTEADSVTRFDELELLPALE